MIGYLHGAFPVERMRPDRLPGTMSGQPRGRRIPARRARTDFEWMAADRKPVAPTGRSPRTRSSELQGRRWKRLGAARTGWQIGIQTRRPCAGAGGEALASVRLACVPAARERARTIRVDSPMHRAVAIMIDRESGRGPVRQSTTTRPARTFSLRCHGAGSTESFRQATSRCINRGVKPSDATHTDHGPDRAARGISAGAEEVESERRKCDIHQLDHRRVAHGRKACTGGRGIIVAMPMHPRSLPGNMCRIHFNGRTVRGTVQLSH